MISLALAAALTVADVDRILEHASLRSYQQRSESYAGLERRSTYCALARDAMEGVFELRKAKVRGTIVLVGLPDLVEKNGGPVYTLREEDMKRLDLAVLTAEQKAEDAKIRCGA